MSQFVRQTRVDVAGLNGEEEEMVDKVVERDPEAGKIMGRLMDGAVLEAERAGVNMDGPRITVEFHTNGPFTIVILRGGDVTVAGASKFNPHDPQFMVRRGRLIALRNAFSHPDVRYWRRKLSADRERQRSQEMMSTANREFQDSLHKQEVHHHV